jgi:two-component system, NtrC family, sensor kinase
MPNMYPIVSLQQKKVSCINLHGKRAENIIKSMLEHSRTIKGERQLTDINALTEEYLRLDYHSYRAKDKSYNATIATQFEEAIGKVNIVPQELGRVLLNLFNNAFYAVAEMKKVADVSFQPKVKVSTKKLRDKIVITVSDNGTGITQQALDKIFQPIFTTKPTGQGTGLGLSLSYDVIKAHGGELKVESAVGEGATFEMLLPI